MRLIDVEPLEGLINQHLETTDSALFLSALSMFARVLEMTPTADAVPVVRCKDCKHYAFTDNRVPQERVWWCYYWGYEIGADDFCSNGERRDDETD